MRERKNTRAKSLTRLGHREGNQELKAASASGERPTRGKEPGDSRVSKHEKYRLSEGGVSGMTARNVSERMKDISILYCQQVQVKTIKRINIFLYRGCMLKFSERLKRKILLKSQLLSLHQSVSTQGKGDRTC